MASALDVLKQQTANGNGMKVSGSNGTSSSGKTNPEQAQQQMSSGLAALTGSYKPNGNGMRIGQDIPTATQYRAAQQTAYDRYKQQLSAATTSAQRTMEAEKAKTNWLQRALNTAGASDYFDAKNAYIDAANDESAFDQYWAMQGGKNTGMSIAQLEAQSKAKLEEAQTALRNAEMGYATGSLSPMGAVAAARYSKSQNASLQADVDQAQAAYNYYHSIIEQQNAEARETAKSDAFNTGYSQYRSEQESSGISTQEAYSAAKSNRESAQASYNEAKKAYEREQRNQRAAIQYGLPYDASQLDRAKADMDSAKAALDDAETRVSYADRYSMDGVNLNPDFAKVSAQGTAQFEADLRSERLQRVIDNSSSVQMELETGMATEDDIYQRYYGNGETSDHYGDKSSYYESGRAEDYSPTRYADEWSDAEKQKFGYLYATDKEAAYRYGRSVNAAIIAKHNAEADKKTAAWATENFVAGTLASGSSLAASTYGALFEYEDMLGQYLGSGDIMAKEGSVTQYSNAVQTAIASDLNAQYGTIDSSLPVIGGKGLGDLYQIGMSSAQSSLSATTLGSAGTMVSFFGQAAAQGVYDAINRGATPDQAIMLGTLNGIMEGVGEALSVEYFLGPVMEGLGQELSQQILRTLIQGGIEASEEGFTTLLNSFCDHLVMGDKSELNQNIASYKELGYSDEEARKLAFKDWWSGIAWDMVAGFGSGFGMGAVSTIGHNLSANLTAYNTNATHGFTAQDLIDMAEYSESDTAKDYAKRVQAVLNGEARTAFKDKKTGARNISARQGEILESRLSSEFSEKDRAAYTAAASDRMKQIDEKGTVTQSQREQFADILGRSAMGEDISRRDEKTVARNDVASQAALEMLTVGWADNADTYITGENSKLANVRRNRSVQKGQTVTVDGKEHKLSGIAVKDGKPYVKLTQKDGTASEMALSDIELDETTADLIENLTAKFGDKAQGAFSLYSGADTARYAAGLHQAVYSYAAEGVSLEAIKVRAKNIDSLMHILNEQQIEWAYAVGKELHDSGKTKAKEKGQQNKEQRDGKTVKAEGKVSLSGAEGFGDAVRVSDLTAKQKKVLEAIQAMAKVTGFNYVLYDGKTNTFGAYQDGTIYVNINAARGSRNVVMATLSHELTHTLEQYAPEEYAELREAIKEKIIAERGAEAWELMIDAKIRREAQNRKLSTEDAISEIVADGCEMMLKNSQAFKELAMEHTDLAEKLIGLLEDLISRIKDAFEDVTAGYRESQLLSDMEDIQQKWDAAFKEAVKQRNYEVGSVRENSHAEAVELVEEILTAPEITHVQARSIVKTEEMRKIFEQLTGISLDGLSNNKAQEAVLNYRDSGAKYASAFAEEAKFSVYDESLTKEIRRRISDTVEKAISEKGKLGIKYNQQRISRIPSNIVEIARIASGGKINLKGKFYALNGDYIYHEYNRHAVSDNDPKKIADELARHQIAFTKQRFKNAISCFLNPTMVECIYPDANNPTQNSAIAFAKKTTDGNYVIAVSVGGKNNPNICPMEIVYVDRQKWNAYIGKGKTISEMLYENSKAKIKTAIPFEYNKKNQVTAALIKAINSSDASLHSPQFADSVLQTEKEIKKNLQKSTWSEADEEYLRLAENPTENAAKIEKLVKQAAKEAMPYTKVLDKKGMPLVLYHGTTSKGQFHTFKDGMIFMFSRENYADQYTHTRGAVSVNPVQTGRVMPLFANITNPLVIDANRKLWKNIDVPWTTDKLTTDEIAAYAKEHKYDGVILKRVRDNMFDDDTGYCDEYIVFDKSQVKSAGPSYRNEKRDTFPWESRDVLDRAVGVTYDDNGNPIPLSERFNADNPDIRYSTWSEDENEYSTEEADAGSAYIATDNGPESIGTYNYGGKRIQFQTVESDPDILDFLNGQVERGEVTHTYKALIKIGDRYYPPMASLEQDENGKYTKLRGGNKIGDWIKSEGKLTPEMIEKMPHKSPSKWKKDYASQLSDGRNPWGFYLGDFGLNKADANGKSQGKVGAAYNPYQHSSDMVLNDQFEGAYERPQLVFVEGIIPNSEINDPYWAPYAKDPTGPHSWKSGPIAGQLKKSSRTVYMTRWYQPIRELSNEEVADRIMEYIEKEDSVPRLYWNTFSPGVLKALVDKGVPIDPYGSPLHLSKEGARDMYGNIVPESVKIQRAAEKSRKKSNSVKLSTWSEEELESGVKEIGDTAIISDTGKIQLSISTYREGGRQILRDYLNDQVKSGAVSEADAADMLQQMETIYDICKKFTKDYALFGQWSEAEVVVDPVTHAPVFSVVKKNNEYAMNLDFSLVCKKRRTLDAVFNEMIKQGIMDNFEMVEGSIAAINDIIRENGFETACALCFVDSKRYRQALVADSFVSIWNSFVRSMAKEGHTIDYHNFGGNEKIKNTGTGIDSLPNSDLDFTAIDKALHEERAGTVVYKVAKYLKEHPQDRKLLQRGDFMSSKGFDTIKLQNRNILKLYNSKKGTGGPKATESDVQYLNEIIRKRTFNAQKAFTVGGVRIQSFSDYIGRLVFDYVQMVADLAAKKLPAHAYTKEALFALQFGLTGIKTNMSLVPDVIDDGVAPGLDKNGNYAWRDGQSFGSTVYDGSEAFIKECLKIIGKKYTGQRRLTAEEGYQLALAIQNATGYSTNCGTIAVGISDEHIRKMLRDPMIRMIIPYHKSSLNHIVAAMTNIDRYKDYTEYQSTRDSEGKKLAKGKDTFNFNVTLQKLGDAKAAADAYLKWCDDHGYIPKFDQFRNEEGYYKLLEDFTCYDRDGASVPQQAVKMTMPQAGDAFGDLKHMIRMGLEEDSLLQAKQDEAVPRIIDQIKTVLPQKEADGFHYSIYDDSSSDSIKEANERVLAYERIEKENRQLKSAVIKYKKMADYWKQQSEETKEVTVRESDVYALTKQLLDKMDSKADAKMIRDRLKGLLDMMEQSDEQQMEDMYDAFMEEAIDIGRTAAQEAWAVIDDSQADVNRELVSYMKDVTLLITDGDIHDANCESLKEFRAMIGKDVKVSRSKGQSVDQVYYELSHEYPYLFDEDITSAAEQIIAIANAIDDTAPVEGNPHEGHIGEVAMWFANDLMEAYLDDQIRQTAPTRADRYKAAINRAKSQNAELKRKAASDLKQAKADAKADTKAKVEAAKAKAKDRLDRQIERDADKLQRQAEKDEKRIRDIKDRLELLRMAKNERIEKIREEAAQRLAERDAKLKKEKWAAVKKVSDHYKQKEQNARDRRSRSSATAKIKKLYATIAGELAHPTETKHIPREYVQAMVTVLELINMDTISADRKIAGIDTEISGIRVQSQKDMDKISALNDKANRLRERDAKFKAAVDDLLKLYQSYKDNDRYPYIYEQQIADQLLKLYTEVGNTSLGTMTMDQLELVYRTLQMMYKLSKDALKMQIRDETYKAYEFSHELAQEVKDVPKSVKHLSAAKWLQTQLRPETMFHRLGGFKKNSYWDKYYRLLNDGQLKQTRLQMEMAKTFSDLLTDEKALKAFRSTKDGDLIDTGLVDSDGDAIMLTHDMAVSLYMNLLNEENMRHIAYGGMIVPELKDYMAGKDSLGFGTGMKQYLGIQRSIGEAMAQISDLKKQREDMIASGTVDTQALDAIDSQIDSLNDSISKLELDAMTDMADLKDRLFDAFTDYDKAWIKQTQYLMDVQAKDYLNDTTMDVYGFERATVDNYYPLVVNKDLLRGSTEQIIQEMNLENVGFMKERIKSKKPINLLSVSDIVNMQIDRTAKYCGLMPALRTFNKVWGMTEQSSTDSLRLAIRRKFDQPALDYVDRLLGDLTGTRKSESTTLGSFFDALRGNMAQATLTLNPRVAFAQAASYPTAAAVLGWDALGKGLSKGFLTEADRALIAKWSPLLWYRLQGFSTVELGDIRNSTTTQAEIWRKLKWATGWISAIDGGTVGKLWYASEYYVQDKFSNLQTGSDAYYEKVAEVFNDVVEKTQPNYTTMQRPDLLRNPNAVIKQFTMFMTQRLQNFNIVYDAAATYQKYKADYANSRNDVQLTDVQEAKKNLANAVSSQIVASAMIVGLKLAMDVLLHSMNAYRDDDDELTTQSILLAVLNNFLDTVFGNIAGGSEMYKYIYSLITGEKYYGISLNGVDTFTDLMSDTKSLVDALKSDKTPEQRSKTFNTWLKQLAQFAGIPLNNMEKIGFAFYYHGVDLINGELGSMEAGVDRSNKQNAHILYAALESGDTKKADAIWAEADNPDSLKSALLSYIKEMYTAGDLTAEQAVSKVQAYCGKDANDAYWTVQRWNYAAETGSTDGFSKNNRVMEAVISGNDTEYKAAVQELTEHGTIESTIRSNIKSNVRDMLIGDGSLSEAEAKRILTKYCGLTATDASATVAAWKLQDSNKAYEGLTTDQVISYERTYELYGKPAGLSFDTTVSIIQWKNSQMADKDADGKAISGSLKKKVVEHIDAMSITDAQKDAMYMACGYADSTLGSTPWHKRK